MEYIQFREKLPDAQPAQLDKVQVDVITAWQMMENEIQWPALEFIAEYLNVNDVELFMDGLILMQQIKKENIQNGR